MMMMGDEALGGVAGARSASAKAGRRTGIAGEGAFASGVAERDGPSAQAVHMVRISTAKAKKQYDFIV